MKEIHSKQTIISVLAVIIGLAVIFPLSNFIEKNRPPLPEGYEDQDLALHGAKLKGFALGFEGLIADWYWISSLQYLGNKILNSKNEHIDIENLKSLNPRQLYPLLDNATDLDPKFSAVYNYGAVVLPAINPDEAIKIAEKGIRENPGDWQFYQQLGFIYWRLNDYEKASEFYEKGAEIAGAPAVMRLMATQIKTQGASRATKRAIYKEIFEQSTDTQTKEISALRLLELDSLDERDLIRTALQDFQAKNNRCPNSWREVIPFLRNQKTLRFDSATFAPVDPTNVPYLLQNTDKCDVAVDGSTSKIPVQ